jgi:hypothetical protein
VIVAVHLLFQINGDGETNWLEGVQLLSVYLILGILFFSARRFFAFIVIRRAPAREGTRLALDLRDRVEGADLFVGGH